MSLVLQSLLPYPHSCQGTSPHQQGWDTKMAMLSFCGIDVSKDRLDVVVLSEGWFFSVSNDTAGWAELVARLRPLTVSAIGLEPSGGYERGRSEEHTSELQSLRHLVCRLLLEKKKTNINDT